MTEQETTVDIVPRNSDEAGKVTTKEELKPLTPDEMESIEKAKKEGCSYKESTEFIKENINVAIEVARQLYLIHEYDVYREEYNSFEDYLVNEFNYTCSRAYQLIRAYRIASYVNKELGWNALITEAQCRALAQLPAYDNGDEEDENLTVSEKKLKAQLELVRDLTDPDSKIPPKTKAIAEKVKEVRNATEEGKLKNTDLKRRQEIRTAFSNVQKEIDTIFSDVKFTKAKKIALEKLKKLTEFLRKLE